MRFVADGRMLKRVVAQSRRLANLKNDSHRLLYTWLIPFLDVEGRYNACPDIIKGSVVPRLKHFNEKNIQEALIDMANNELILLYQSDGEQYLELRKFEDHQTNLRKDRESPSKIPPSTNDNLINAGLTPEFIGVREEKRREVKRSKCSNEGFEDFWKVYPRKVNKKEAQSAWNKAKIPSLDTIIQAIERQKKSDQWIKDSGQYIPYPSSWLNKERWNDELTYTAGSVAKKPHSNYFEPVNCPKCEKRIVLKGDLTPDGGCIYCEVGK